MTKICFKCNKQKPTDEFYHRPGRRQCEGSCKKCKKEYDVERRKTHRERLNEYDRARASTPDRLKAKIAYTKTEAGLAVKKRGNAKWNKNNTHKINAQQQARRNLKKRGLEKKPCEVCGSIKRIEMHHDDYNKPLDVRFLCYRHHYDHHKAQREEGRAMAKLNNDTAERGNG